MSTYSKMSPETVAAVRRRIQLAFGKLREVGFITETNFACCRTCAMFELGEIAEKQQRNRAVYWHGQDETDFREGSSLNVRYCYFPPKGIEGDTTRVETEIGEQVVAVLEEAGLELDWNGNPNVVIRITGVATPSTDEQDLQDAGTA
jgi:hypothetical protein